MSKKIIGVTVGSPLPKPNLMQTDPKKGDYVKGKEEFLKQIVIPDSGGNAGFVVQDTEPEDTSVLWVDPTDNSEDGFQEAVNAALAQAKESGEFDGEPGQPGAPGEPGEPGKDYVLTDADKTEIAELAADLVKVPSDEHINDLINTALGVIENGTY